jgi:hypothetical protein
MTTRKFIFATLCTALMAAAGGASAMPQKASTATSKDACVFSKYDASTVAPFNADENFGYGNYTQLKGAQVFVPAREGLTEQWLTREVQTAFAKSGTESCQPNVKNVQVQVVSGGSGFWVQLIAADAAQGKQLLDWARGVVPVMARH